MMMTAPHPDVLDTLADLLAAQQDDLVQFLAGADPYVGRNAVLRRLLDEIRTAQSRRQQALAELVDNLGGTLRPARASAELQYLAFLRADFLLPRLIESRSELLGRYRDALDAFPDAPAEVVALLRAQAGEIEQEHKRLSAALA